MGLDWNNQPRAFKDYPGVPRFPLSRDAALPLVSPWRAFEGGGNAADVDSQTLSAVLFHAAGLTRSSFHKGGEFFYRACPSAGALYPCEVYLAWPGSDALAAGLYHYDVSRHALARLRDGFPGPEALGLPERSRLPGEAILLVTAIFFRSAWKYRARAYRYLNLDAGHVAEGLSLGLSAFSITHAVEPDFDDEAVNAFLGVDPGREGCLAAVRFACGSPGQAAAPGELPDGVEGLSRMAASDPVPAEVLAVHAACSTVPAGGRAMPCPALSGLGERLGWRDLPAGQGAAERLGLFEAMQSRKSRRAFVPGQAGKGVLAKAAAALLPPLYPERDHPCENACAVGLSTGAESFAGAGFSLLDRQEGRFGRFRDGDMRQAVAVACLDQLWIRNAALQAVFMIDFDCFATTLGDRGYRAALLAAGRLGHRLYLAAESLGLGACGVGAFYDEEASELLGLPGGTGLAYVVAVGAVKR